MTKLLTPFHGTRKNENPRQFLKDIEGLYGTDAERVTAFVNRLVADGFAERWYDSLPSSNKASWTALKTEFLLKWPKPPHIVMDAEAVTVRLTTMKCDPALLGTYDTSGLEEVPYHIAWAREICRVAMLHDAPDSMVVTIHSALPRPLKRHSGNPKTWHELLTNVEGVPMTTLVDDVNDWKAINELRHNNDATVAALQRNATLENSVASLQHSMQSLQLNRSPAPSALPVNRFPFSGNQPIPAGRGIPQSARAPSMNPATLTQPPALPILPAPDAVARLTALRTNILVHHPDSEPGHIAYKTQITEWTQKNPNATPDETKPYPLTPGTAPRPDGDALPAKSIVMRALAARPTRAPPMSVSWTPNGLDSLSTSLTKHHHHGQQRRVDI
ncbi:hypothetical protein A0H81_13347 [Grifola frondosa]|uniref:Retrotransposon gag domain-containing protein n=1 Tax=Grifola frondosa TaxID=5627 RepID=A0A1C7LQ66_GRIFR|nr:hypothetical protein A0H81_13347 [Grifola frondosa]